MFRRLALTALPTFVLVTGGALVVAPMAASPVAVASDAAPRNPEGKLFRPWVFVSQAVAAPRNPEGHALRPWVPIAEPSVADRAVSRALEVVGVPYRYGGESPGGGFDCSGLVRWSYGQVGVDVPHNSYALYSVGRRVERSRIAAGDVLFFEGLGHVGLYLGKGRMVHAPYTGKNVEVVSLAATNYGRRLIGARRVVPS